MNLKNNIYSANNFTLTKNTTSIDCEFDDEYQLRNSHSNRGREKKTINKSNYSKETTCESYAFSPNFGKRGN